MPISTFTIPFPDFVLNTIIDPEQFDSNNATLVNKINEIINDYNDFIITTNANLMQKSTDLNNHKTSTDHDNRYATLEAFATLNKGAIKIKREVFTISSDPINSTFTYTNKDGAVRTGIITAEGYQEFTLEEGIYEIGTNTIKAIIDDTIQRNAASDGLIESANNKIQITTILPIDTEVTIEYFEITGIINVEVGTLAPINPYYGKVWIDINNINGNENNGDIILDGGVF